MAIPLPSRTLGNYLASLPTGTGAGVVDQSLVIRTDLATMAQAVPAGGLIGQTLVKVSDTSYDFAWADSGAGDMLKSVYDPQNIEADAFDRANQTGTQDAATITGLALVATTGAYADLSGTPTIPTYLAPRVVTVASTATLTPNASNTDVAAVSAQAAALTIAAPTGSPVDGQQLVVRIRDNGTARALTWNAAYVEYSTGQLPATTIIGKTVYAVFMYNLAATAWELVGGTVAGLWG